MVSRSRQILLEVDGARLPVEIVANRRATRLTLRIVPGAHQLRLSTPPHVREKTIDDFLDRNRNWVAERLKRLPEPVRPADGVQIPFLGRPHRVQHVDRLRGLVEPRMVDGEPVLLVPGEKDAVGRRLRRFLAGEARERLNEAVALHAEKLSVRPRSIRITDTSSRWGSCSTTRTLSFSWRIVMAPEEVLDYLAAHETAHLQEMNHSSNFWKLVRELCPEMDRQKDWLKRNGPQLHAIRFD